jgi:hypothetical protein
MQKVLTRRKFGRDVFIRCETNAGYSKLHGVSRGNSRGAVWAPSSMVNHDNFANRMTFASAMIHSNFCPINF